MGKKRGREGNFVNVQELDKLLDKALRKIKPRREKCRFCRHTEKDNDFDQLRRRMNAHIMTKHKSQYFAIQKWLKEGQPKVWSFGQMLRQ